MPGNPMWQDDTEHVSRCEQRHASAADERFARASWTAACISGAIAGGLIPITAAVMLVAGLLLGNIMHRSLQTARLVPSRAAADTPTSHPQRDSLAGRAGNRAFIAGSGVTQEVLASFALMGAALGLIRKYRCMGCKRFRIMHGLLTVEHERIALFGTLLAVAVRLRLYVHRTTPIRWTSLRPTDSGVPMWMAASAWTITACVLATLIHSWWRVLADFLVLRLQVRTPRP
jgi:hypothetical protein